MLCIILPIYMGNPEYQLAWGYTHSLPIDSRWVSVWVRSECVGEEGVGGWVGE